MDLETFAKSIGLKYTMLSTFETDPETHEIIGHRDQTPTFDASVDRDELQKAYRQWRLDQIALFKALNPNYEQEKAAWLKQRSKEYWESRANKKA